MGLKLSLNRREQPREGNEFYNEGGGNNYSYTGSGLQETTINKGRMLRGIQINTQTDSTYNGSSPSDYVNLSLYIGGYGYYLNIWKFYSVKASEVHQSEWIMFPYPIYLKKGSKIRVYNTNASTGISTEVRVLMTREGLE